MQQVFLTHAVARRRRLAILSTCLVVFCCYLRIQQPQYLGPASDCQGIEDGGKSSGILTPIKCLNRPYEFQFYSERD